MVTASFSLQTSMKMLMNSFTSTPSSRRWYQLQWLQTSLLLVLSIIFHANPASSSKNQISYANNCASFVPETSPTVPDFYHHPLRFPGFQYGYYIGGNRILNQNSFHYSYNFSKPLSFYTQIVYRTNVEGVSMVKGSLNLLSKNMYYFEGKSSPSMSLPKSSLVGSVSFELEGFWSISSGKLCMVGSASGYSREGRLLDLAAVLKLNNVKNSNTITDLVTGTLESLNSNDDLNYFEPISMLVFPKNHEYNLVSKDYDVEHQGGFSVPGSMSLGSNSFRSICSILEAPRFELEYTHECYSSKNCTPFGVGIGYLPQLISTKVIQFLDGKQRLQVLVKFQNMSHVQHYRPFNPVMTLVGEGLLDVKKNQLYVVACRIFNAMDSLANAYVGDCSTRLSLRFPAIWSIRNRSSMVGEIWSKKTLNDSGYFSRIMFLSPTNRILGLPGMKYEYTEIDRVKALCPKKKPIENKGVTYPNGYSLDMEFGLYAINSGGETAWGKAIPLSGGDMFYESESPIFKSLTFKSLLSFETSVVKAQNGPLNMSYGIGFTLTTDAKLGRGITLDPNTRVEISAEGTYDPETGGLCMVGCQRLASNIQMAVNESHDCKILIKLQFPSLNSKTGSYIKGSIESTREKSDPLYFKILYLSSTSILSGDARRSIWRINLEIIMILTSYTLSCLFLLLQLFHVEKYPDVLPSISLVMLVILTLGHMIPLMLGFEALVLGSSNWKNIFLGGSGWLELNELVVRVVRIVPFLLQFRLLWLTWSARLGGGSVKGLWIAEKRALYMSLPLYAAGGLTAWFACWMKNKYGVLMLSSRLLGGQHHSILGNLKSYTGLVLDGFLLPQILLNIFQNSKENALSCSFYIGTTFVQVLPHLYDLYRAHNFVDPFDGSYIYANPDADFYSAAWDVIIPSVGLLFALIIFLQQRFGGRCILPKRFRSWK